MLADTDTSGDNIWFPHEDIHTLLNQISCEDSYGKINKRTTCNLFQTLDKQKESTSNETVQVTQGGHAR